MNSSDSDGEPIVLSRKGNSARKRRYQNNLVTDLCRRSPAEDLDSAARHGRGNSASIVHDLNPALRNATRGPARGPARWPVRPPAEGQNADAGRDQPALPNQYGSRSVSSPSPVSPETRTELWFPFIAAASSGESRSILLKTCNRARSPTPSPLRIFSTSASCSV